MNTLRLPLGLLLALCLVISTGCSGSNAPVAPAEFTPSPSTAAKDGAFDTRAPSDNRASEAVTPME